MYMKRKTVPSLRPILSLDRKYHRRRLVISENIAKFAKAAISTFNGEAVKVTLRMQVMSMKQLPTMFPSASSK